MVLKMSKAILKDHLKELYNLLKDEKNALVEDRGHEIQAIVEKKEILIEKIERFKGKDFNNDKEVLALKKEIDSIQELNLLLTKQALSYQKAMVESIAKNLQNISNTYSNKGQYNKSGSINLINQKV